jgi:biopolymer transport protein ExbD
MDTGPSPAATSAVPSALGEAALVPRKPLVDEARFDITAMVDLVFMMNIYFLVCWITSALAEVDLPPARHGKAVDGDMAVTFTVTREKGQPPMFYVGERKVGKELALNEISARVGMAVEEGQKAGKNVVLIKAERGVRFKDVARVATAAAEIKGMKLHLAVMEKD